MPNRGRPEPAHVFLIQNTQNQESQETVRKDQRRDCPLVAELEPGDLDAAERLGDFTAFALL
jgi:hypothetical protein